jgi:26S proteasome non-ATPase regulatory subunit 10
LLTEGADVNIRDNRGATALHRAASQGRTPIVNVLLASPGIEVSPVDVDGNTPLYVLIDNLRFYYNQTTFRHLACDEDRREDAMELVQRGASLTVKNREEKTPVDLAAPGLAKNLRECSEQ